MFACLSHRLVHGDRVVLHNGAALPARGRGLGGDEQTREAGRGVVEAREGRHTVHQLLYHLCQHVGAERVLAPDPQRLVEVLHGVGEVPSQSLDVAQGGVGAGVQGREY